VSIVSYPPAQTLPDYSTDDSGRGPSESIETALPSKDSREGKTVKVRRSIVRMSWANYFIRSSKKMVKKNVKVRSRGWWVGIPIGIREGAGQKLETERARGKDSCRRCSRPIITTRRKLSAKTPQTRKDFHFCIKDALGH